MSERRRLKRTRTVSDVCAAMESIAPLGLAQSWDNVGLLAGDPRAGVARMLACIDLTPPVVEEAVGEKIDLVLAYHPPIFKPVAALRADGSGAESAVFQCIRNDIALYATHTALDAADGGPNDIIASLCGITQTGPLEYVDQPSVDECKLVVFIPPAEVEEVAGAMFSAGAGRIGDYSRCSYRTTGQGTFFGDESTSPAVGERGRMEYVDEIRLETIVPVRVLPAVVRAMIKAHSYEEPAFDIYPLKSRPVGGIGRVGKLPRAITLEGLARKLRRLTQAACVQIIGPPDRMIERAAIHVGAFGRRELQLARTRLRRTQTESPRVASRAGEESARAKNPHGLKPAGQHGDVIITGEIRHHDALMIQRTGCTAIALGHWASERPALKPLTRRLQNALRGVHVKVSTTDCDPFHPA